MSQIEILKHDTKSHSDIVSAIEFGSSCEVYSFSDDSLVNQYSSTGNLLGTVKTIDDTLVLDCHRAPTKKLPAVIAAKSSPSIEDTIAVACTDGTFRLITPKRVNKKEAHKGAVLCIRWSWDGAQIATSGEDGQVMVWSKTGEGTQAAKSENPVFALAWSPSDDQLAYCTGNRLIVRSVQSSRNQQTWVAHGGIILSLDWSPAHGMIVSGGEDFTYRVWTPQSRNVYTSRALTYPVTSVRWAPGGEYFCVGLFNTILLCDKSGWQRQLLSIDSASISHLAFDHTGSTLAASGIRRSVVICKILKRPARYGNYVAEQEDTNKIKITDIQEDTTDHIDLSQYSSETQREGTMMQWIAMDSHHLVVVTQSQAFCFDMPNFSSTPPHVISFPTALVSLVLLTARHFLLVINRGSSHSGSGTSSGLGALIYSYDGKPVAQINLGQLFANAHSVNREHISLNNHYLAVVDENDGKTVRFFSASSGKAIGANIRIDGGIKAIQLSQQSSEPLLAVIDNSRSLNLVHAKSGERAKLMAVVDSIKWHETTDQLAVIADGQLTVWIYPHGVFVDKTCLERLKITTPLRAVPLASGKGGAISAASAATLSASEGMIIESFTGNQVCYTRCADGVVLWAGVKPWGLLLHQAVLGKNWDEANKLCRYVNDKPYWTCFAVMAVEQKELTFAELGYASLGEIDKVRYMVHLRQIPYPEVRNAEILLFKRRVAEAERVLLSAGYKRQAIKMYCRLSNWERMMQIAEGAAQQSRKEKDLDEEDEDREEGGDDGSSSQSTKSSVNLIEYAVGLRRRYLENWNTLHAQDPPKTETIPAYLKYKDLDVNLDEIKRTIKEEKLRDQKALKRSKQPKSKKEAS